jgi:hypothetical protein
LLANQVEIFMTTHSMPSTTWRTASFADSTDATLLDAFALGKHLDVCRRSSASLFALQRGVEWTHRFLAGRFVTTLTLIAVIIGLSSLAI